jgi:muramoyltetrapeptide carboxypeptidase
VKQFKNNPLQKGDIVDLVLPASGLPADVIQLAEAFLNSWGLKARYPKEMLKPHLIFAQSDERRFQFLKDALMNKQSKAVWCLRGGYGSNRLLPFLKDLKSPAQSKFFIGISDVTSLHLFLNQKWGWITYHGSLIDRLAKNTLSEKCKTELKQILFGDISKVQFLITPCNDLARKITREKARIVGGNLVTIQSSLGTRDEIKTQKKFLFFEELNERGYRLDRMLEQLHQSGKFKDCAGLLVGHVLGGEEKSSEPGQIGKSTWDILFKDWQRRLKIPVFSGVPTGHGEDLHCLPLNALAEITQVPHKTKTLFEIKVDTGVIKK